MPDAKNEPTLVNSSKLQAGTTLQYYPLEQTLIDDDLYLVFVKLELIPHKQYEKNPLKSGNVPPRNQNPAHYHGIPQKTPRSAQSSNKPWLS